MSPATVKAPDPDDDRSGDSLRRPPVNYEAERALLGAILMNNRAYERVSEFLAPGHFADTLNGRVYYACMQLIEKGSQANPVTLKNILEKDDLIIAAGGIKYLTGLAASAVTIINAADYGKLVYDMFLRRELIDLGESLVNAAFEVKGDEPAVDLIEAAETDLFSLRETGASSGELVGFDDIADEALEMADVAHRREGALTGITTGLTDLDTRIAGLHDSDLLIIAGRPSMGKTALARTISYNAAHYFKTTERPEHKGKFVAFYSLEMSRDQMITPILAHKAKVNSFAIRAGRLTNDEMTRLSVARQDLYGLPIKVDDTAAATVAQIRARCRRLARLKNPHGDNTGSLGLIVIDYLQLISGGSRERVENRVQEISAITRGLKALAKELNVPVIALSQLSRAVEQRDDKRPQLSDLRESGTIEQDSDVVMFVYREQYYLERSEPRQRADESTERFHERQGKWHQLLEAAQNVLEIIISKQRHGPIGTVRTHFQDSSAWASDLIPETLVPQNNQLF